MSAIPYIKRGILYLVLPFLLVGSLPDKLYAQDEGPLSMQIVAVSSLGGVGLGAILGAALWLLDPLAENADLRESMLVSAGYGALVGAGFGVFHLTETAVFPPLLIDPDEEFLDDQFIEEGMLYQRVPLPRQTQVADKPRKYALRIPLFQLNYRF